MTCFFDASHGPATQEITWTPQWGAPRPIRCCAACAQRWMEYLQGQSGYPQAGYQQGYPQPAYPQQGYPQPGYRDYDDHPQRRQGYGMGAVAAAGAAGFLGGMVVNELLDDDDEHVEHVEHVEVVEHVVDDDGDYGGDW